MCQCPATIQGCIFIIKETPTNKLCPRLSGSNLVPKSCLSHGAISTAATSKLRHSSRLLQLLQLSYLKNHQSTSSIFTIFRHEVGSGLPSHRSPFEPHSNFCSKLIQRHSAQAFHPSKSFPRLINMTFRRYTTSQHPSPHLSHATSEM